MSDVQKADDSVCSLKMNGESDIVELDLDQSSGTNCLQEHKSVSMDKLTTVNVEDIDLTVDMVDVKDDACCPTTTDEPAPVPVANGNTESTTATVENIKNISMGDSSVIPACQGGASPADCTENIRTTLDLKDECTNSVKHDINGNMANEKDNNLEKNDSCDSSSKLTHGRSEMEGDSPNRPSAQILELTKKDESPNIPSSSDESKPPIKRKTNTPSNLPLSVNGTRNSRTSSPSSPTQKSLVELRRKPPSPVVSRKGGAKADSPTTPKKGGRSPNGENKFVFKRTPSRSKLPVASPQSPDTPKSPTITPESYTGDKSVKLDGSQSKADDTQFKAEDKQPRADDKQAKTDDKQLKSDGNQSKADGTQQTPKKFSVSKKLNDRTSPVGTPPSTPTASTPVKDVPATSTPVSKDTSTTPLTIDLTTTTPKKEQTDHGVGSLRRKKLTLEEQDWEEKVKQFQELKMAMKQINEDPRTKFLRCLFCTNLFTLTGREPRMLACCLNAICSACASRLCMESPSHLRCPVCRQNISLPQDRTSDSIDLTDESVVDGGLMDLPIEVIRTKMMEFQHIQKGLTFPCSHCTSKPLSTWFCENCDNYMCDDCRDQHKEEVKSKRHSTIAIPTLKSRQLRDFKQHHYCKEHNFSKLTLYCTTCKKVICSTCTRDGHERETHTVLTINEAFGARIKQAAKLLSKARKKHRHLNDYAKCLKAKSDCNEVSSNSAKDVINDTFDRLMDVMQHRRTELLAEVERESATLATSATVDTDSADCRLSMLNTATDYTKEFKSKADSVEFLQLFQTVSSTLRTVLDFSHDQVNTSRQGVVFSPWNLRLVETLLKTAGQLRVVTYKPTGRPGREEVNLKPALHPEGHDVDARTTLPNTAQGGETKDVVCCPDNRVIMIPATEDRGEVIINCPRLDFDLQTVHSDRTVTTEGAMINHAPERPLPNTGCRLRAYPGAMADTALDGTGFHLWSVKTKVAIKQRVPDNKMLFEAALTGTPVDAPLSQRIDTSLVLAGCDLHHELCIKVKYCCKNLAHFSGCKNAAGIHADFRFGILLDFDRRRLHVLDLANNVVIGKAERISVHKPLWSMFCVGRFTFADVKMKLDTADKVTVTPDLYKLLTKIVDQERSK